VAAIKLPAKTRSQGASLGIGSSGVNSVGFHQAKSDKNSKTVLLTSITAKQVNITTQDHTQLTGSLIAATDTSVSIVDVIGGGIAVFACLSWIAVRQCYVKPN
jgi:hypothetical protein